MTITKGQNTYNVTESKNKWFIKAQSGKAEIVCEVSKTICKNEAELREYINSNEMF